MAEIPKSIGNFKIRRCIGEGASGVVYLAYHPHLHTQVALKKLLNFDKDKPELAAEFIKEAQIAASLNHANIVSVQDLFDVDGEPIIQMEYLPRGALRSMM